MNNIRINIFDFLYRSFIIYLLKSISNNDRLILFYLNADYYECFVFKGNFINFKIDIIFNCIRNIKTLLGDRFGNDTFYN